MTSERLVDCPHCKQWVSCNESSTDQVAKCEDCGKKFRVPATIPPPPPVEAKPAAAIPAIQPATDLLQQILAAQHATNVLLSQIADHNVQTCRWLSKIRDWMIIAFLLATILFPLIRGAMAESQRETDETIKRYEALRGLDN